MRQSHLMIAALALTASSPAFAQSGTDITAPGPQGDLAGTLVLPDAAQSIVLIIPGSGPTDRDGNNPLGVSASSYRLLAKALAQEGVGSLRIDKRGMFGSRAAVPDANAVTLADYASDIGTWAAKLRETQGDSCLYLLGHSEGGIVALAAAPQIDDLCGVILVATPGRPLGTVMREQLQANPANTPLLADAMAAIDQLEKGEAVDTASMHPALQSLFNPAVQPFLIDMMARDPAEMIADITVPILIVQGGRDLQTPTADGDALRTANPDGDFAFIAAMNHVLKTVESDDRMANLATYADPSVSLAPGLVPFLTGFIDRTADARADDAE